MCGLQSKTAKARSNSESLRATIPSGIVEFLELTLGDSLDWKMEFKNGERLVEVTRVREQ